MLYRIQVAFRDLQFYYLLVSQDELTPQAYM